MFKDFGIRPETTSSVITSILRAVHERVNDLNNCHVCGHGPVVLKKGLSKYNSITSDCRIWREPVLLLTCPVCWLYHNRPFLVFVCQGFVCEL